MGRALRYTYKLLRAWRDDGFKGAVRAGVDRIIQKGEAMDHEFTRPYRTVRDILFINGCPPEVLPHPYRYRVLHQMEQARAAGYSVGEVICGDVTPETALEGNVLVFYRCPWDEKIDEVIRTAKTLKKKVVFDMDDLNIDTIYTDGIPAVQAMSPEERKLYDDGVRRYGKTLRLCEAATTTTTRLAEEMRKFVPDVYINRNCASEKMVLLSEAALAKQKENRDGVIIGYFSGSITHNADFEMILPALERILSERSSVRVLLMGELDLPEGLKRFGEKVIQKPFADWETLPEIIAGVDINLAPVEQTIFNEAKSENKWVEAALVKVPTVASPVGPFAEMIRDGETGFLAEDGEWYQVLDRVIREKELRKKVGEQAYRYCREHCVTTQNAAGFRDIYEGMRRPHAGFVLPSCEISGGIMVALRHACFLQDAGWNVDLIVPTAKWSIWKEFGHSFACHSYKDGGCDHQEEYDLLVGTMWTTVEWIRAYPKVRKRAYLVQNYERDFYEYNNPERLDCESTYMLGGDWKYLTISRWVEGWLRERYHQEAAVMRNGLESERFKPRERDWTGRKIRILIEGDCAADYKNVDESFRIVDKLGRQRYEVWYMSYNASPKEEYRYDRFLHAVPYEQVEDVYGQCDILLKSSWLESFSYPPLEMMATGGWCVVVGNGGNAEYLRDGENCLLYPLGDEDAAVRAIERIVSDEKLRQRLREEGLRTAADRSWDHVRSEILRCYQEAAFPEKNGKN